jgi:hypothetical protein
MNDKICAGCGLPVLSDTPEDVWVQTPTGIACLWVHRDECEEQAIENIHFGPATRIERPEDML